MSDDIARIREHLTKCFPYADDVRVVEFVSGSVNKYYWAVVDFFEDSPINIAVRKNHLGELMFFKEMLAPRQREK